MGNGRGRGEGEGEEAMVDNLMEKEVIQLLLEHSSIQNSFNLFSYLSYLRYKKVD